MKTLMTLVALLALTLSYGTAFAIDDQMPSDIGIVADQPVVHDTKDWSAREAPAAAALTTAYDGDVLVPFAPSNDLGLVLARDDEIAPIVTRGAAAGGLGGGAAEHASPSDGNNWYKLPY